MVEAIRSSDMEWRFRKQIMAIMNSGLQKWQYNYRYSSWTSKEHFHVPNYNVKGFFENIKLFIMQCSPG